MRAFAVGLLAAAAQAVSVAQQPRGSPGDYRGDYIWDGHSNPHLVAHHRTSYEGYLAHRNYNKRFFGPKENDPFPGSSTDGSVSAESETSDDDYHIHTDSESYHDSFSDEGTTVRYTRSIQSHDSFDNYARSTDSYHDSDFGEKYNDSDGIFSSLGSSDSHDYDHTNDGSIGIQSVSSIGSEIKVFDYQHIDSEADSYTDGSSSIDSFSESNFGNKENGPFDEYDPYFDYGYALDYDWYDHDVGRVDDYTYIGPTPAVVVDRYKSTIPTPFSYHEQEEAGRKVRIGQHRPLVTYRAPAPVIPVYLGRSYGRKHY